MLDAYIYLASVCVLCRYLMFVGLRFVEAIFQTETTTIIHQTIFPVNWTFSITGQEVKKWSGGQHQFFTTDQEIYLVTTEYSEEQISSEVVHIHKCISEWNVFLVGSRAKKLWVISFQLFAILLLMLRGR